MVMVTSPTARRQHRSRTRYAFALLAILGAATILVVLLRYPASPAAEPDPPLPAPEITVADEPAESEPGWWPPTEPGWSGPTDRSDAGRTDAARADADNQGGATRADAESGGGAQPAAEAAAQTDSRQADISRSLFWSGVLGLTISLAGLGLVGARRQMW